MEKDYRYQDCVGNIQQGQLMAEEVRIPFTLEEIVADITGHYGYVLD